jgi:UDP-N-acetylmuramate dehydrogenase
VDLKPLHHRLTLAFPELKAYLNHPLAPYTTVKIGGPADLFIQTSSNDELIKVIEFLSEANTFSERRENNKRRCDEIFRAQSSEWILRGREHGKFASQAATAITILGNGSNVLISDSGIRGIVIKNTDYSIEFHGNLVTAASGTPLPLLINQTVDHNLTGLEEFTYIPASVGGAVWSNIHGINKNNLDKFIVSVEIFDQSEVKAANGAQRSEPRKLSGRKESSTGNAFTSQKILKHDDLKWNYDFSEFQNHPKWVILSATLSLSQGNSNTSKKHISEIIAKKSATQSMNSLGCIFKNPPNDSAGRIIDQELGLKSYAIGDAQVSEKHANFIVNTGSATAADYLSLIRLIQQRAKKELCINLETEIKLLGQFD